MNQYHWQLSVLSRSIEYKNLTGASKHVGLSQPQLSRIISQLEDHLDMELLDRSSPRHASWTPEARKLAEVYSKTERSLNSAIFSLQKVNTQIEVSIGCLEGLSYLVKSYCHQLLNSPFVSTVIIDIYDLNQLEAKFISMDLDIIFSSRSPKLQKYKFIQPLGFQDFQRHGEDSESIKLISSYEFNKVSKRKKDTSEKLLVSNSLYFRKNFQQTYGGSTSVPGEVHQVRSKNSTEALILGQNQLHKKIWNNILHTYETQKKKENF